jgi:hypothetical protein
LALAAAAMALFCASASQAGAETAPAIQFLMNEPVTMFDLGLMRITEKLEKLRTEHLERDHGKISVMIAADPLRARTLQFPDKIKISSTFASYDFARSILNWDLITNVPLGVAVDEMQSMCTASLEVFREQVLLHIFDIIPPADVLPDPQRISEYIAGWFSHNGPVRRDRPTDIGEQILKISRLQVAITPRGMLAPMYEWYRCAESFVGDSVVLMPPFDAVKLIKDQLALCLVGPTTRPVDLIYLQLTLSSAGKVTKARAYSINASDTSTSDWVPALEKAAHDPRCQPLKLPKDRWPDWQDVHVSYGGRDDSDN